MAAILFMEIWVNVPNFMWVWRLIHGLSSSIKINLAFILNVMWKKHIPSLYYFKPMSSNTIWFTPSCFIMVVECEQSLFLNSSYIQITTTAYIFVHIHSYVWQNFTFPMCAANTLLLRGQGLAHEDSKPLVNFPAWNTFIACCIFIWYSQGNTTNHEPYAYLRCKMALCL